MTAIPKKQPPNTATVHGWVHFCNFGCLREWAVKAEEAAAHLEEQAGRLSPHGQLSVKGVRGLVVN